MSDRGSRRNHLKPGLWIILLVGGLLAAGFVGVCAFWRLQRPRFRKRVQPPRAQSQPFFQDMTAASGVRFTYRNGQEANQYTLLETLGGGIALFDYDGDGLLDIFVTGGGYFRGDEVRGYPCRLYRNLGNWKFQDVTAKVGLDQLRFYTHGAAVADYDRDGWPDLLVTGWGRVALFHNEPVDPHDPRKGRRFREVTREAGLNDRAWSTSAAWADLDGDGFPDLYVCHYVNWSMANNPRCGGGLVPGDVCPPKQFKGREHSLYRNNGDGTFTEVTVEAGLNVWGKTKQRGKEPPEQVEVGKGLGVVAADFSNNGRPSLYVANDTVDNFLYFNRTRRGGPIRLQELGFDKGVAVDDNGVANGSMGVIVGDYDRSGFASLFVTNYEDENHALYRNLGQEQFVFSTGDAGIAAIGQRFVGFGTAFVDLENRGWLDLVIANGHVIRHPLRSTNRQRPVLFRNQEGQGFQAITERGGDYFRTEHTGRGLAVGDLDNDGRADLVISHVNEPLVMLRNTGGNNGRHNHWIGIELMGRKYRDTVGARVIVTVRGRRLTCFATGGGSYLSSGDPRHLFGLGPATAIDRLTVVWPWGKTQHWDGRQFQVDRYWRISEGKPKPQEWRGRATFQLQPQAAIGTTWAKGRP